MPYGEADAVNQLLGMIGPDDEPEAHQPSTPQEEFLFSPTDRPSEPVTSGVNFGAGPDDVMDRAETPRLFNDRVAGALGAQPGAPKEVRALVARMREGL
jgi:hypothetical protein